MAAEEYGWLFCVDCEHSEFVGPDLADMGIECTNCGSERNFANTRDGFYLEFFQLISDWCSHAHAKTGVHKSPEFDLHLTRVRDALSSSDNIIPNPFSELQQSLKPLASGVYQQAGVVDELDVEFMVQIKRLIRSEIALGPLQVYPYPLGHQLSDDNPMGQVTHALNKYIQSNL